MTDQLIDAAAQTADTQSAEAGAALDNPNNGGAAPAAEPPAEPVDNSLSGKILSALRDGATAAAAPGGVPPAAATPPKPGEAPAAGALAAPVIGPDGKPVAASTPAAAAPTKPEPMDAAAEAKLLEGVTHQATRERITGLVGRVRAVEAESQQYLQRAQDAERVTDEMTGWLHEHGIGQEQFTDHLLMLQDWQLANRGDMAAMQRVGESLRTAMREWSLLSGETIGAVDSLAEFPDLRAEVNAKLITEERAIELAGQRQRQQRAQAAQQSSRQQEEQQAQVEQALESSAQALSRWATQITAADPNAQHKLEVVKQAIGRGQFAHIRNPEQLLKSVQDLYAIIPNPAPRPAPPPPPAGLPRSNTATPVPPPKIEPKAENRDQRMQAGILRALQGGG